MIERALSLPLVSGRLHGSLQCPENACALAVLAHTGPHPAYGALSAGLLSHGVAVLDIDILTGQETRFHSAVDNTALHAQRLMFVLDFIRDDGDTSDFKVGIHAADHATPAAIRLAAQRDKEVQAVVTHGGQADRAGLQYLEALSAPLLMLVDSGDVATETSSRHALLHLRSNAELMVTEPHEVPRRSAAWLCRWLRQSSSNAEATHR